MTGLMYRVMLRNSGRNVSALREEPFENAIELWKFFEFVPHCPDFLLRNKVRNSLACGKIFR